MGGYKIPLPRKIQHQIDSKEDRLVNSFVTTRRIPRPPKNNGGGGFGGGTTTHSSGGGTFGGGGRSFSKRFFSSENWIENGLKR